MPRDLGHAKRADLTGHFTGESAEQVSGLAKFLVAASQLAVPKTGSLLGNGRTDKDTELAPRRLGTPGQDTDVTERPRNQAHDPAVETVFDPPKTARPSQLPAARRPSGPVLTPAVEPPLTDAFPELEAPAFDSPADSLHEDESDAETDILPRRPQARDSGLPPVIDPTDTGLLTMDAVSMPEDEKLTTEELRADDDTHLRVGMDTSEKVTSRVDPPKSDPRAFPERPMRDTVNFYNQTQALNSAAVVPGTARAHPVEGTVPLKPRPRDYPDLPSKRYAPLPPIQLPPEREGLMDAEPFEADTGFAQEALTPQQAGPRKDTDRYPQDAKSLAPIPLGAPTQKLPQDDDTQKLEAITRPRAEPPGVAIPTAADTSFDSITERPAAASLAPEPAAALDLPGPTEVSPDFDSDFVETSSDRIVPEYAHPAAASARESPGPARSSDSTADEMPPAEAEPIVLAPGQRVGGPRLSEMVTKRHDVDSEETNRLLDKATTLALKLRQATNQSRADLQAISSGRRSPAPGAEREAPTRRTRSVTDERDDVRVDETPTAPLLHADSLKTQSSIPTSRPRRGRVPTQAIGDIVRAIETKLGETEPLSELLRDVSKRITKKARAQTGDSDMFDDVADPDVDDGLDELVAASAALRAVVESDHDDDRARGETPTTEVDILREDTRVVAESPLARDLDRMWKELSVRKTAVVSKPEPARITRQPKPVAAESAGSLWSTLLGISVVAFALGALFVYILYKMQVFS